MTAPTMTWADFSARYCKTQEQTPEGLLAMLRAQKERYQPLGFFLAECGMMDSSRFMSVVILPYGPNNTFKEAPPADKYFSPRGLASDQSCNIGILPIESLPC